MEPLSKQKNKINWSFHSKTIHLYSVFCTEKKKGNSLHKRKTFTHGKPRHQSDPPPCHSLPAPCYSTTASQTSPSNQSRGTYSSIPNVINDPGVLQDRGVGGERLRTHLTKIPERKIKFSTLRMREIKAEYQWYITGVDENRNAQSRECRVTKELLVPGMLRCSGNYEIAYSLDRARYSWKMQLRSHFYIKGMANLI